MAEHHSSRGGGLTPETPPLAYAYGARDFLTYKKFTGLNVIKKIRRIAPHKILKQTI